MNSILPVIILVIGVFLSVYDPSLFVVLYGITASTKDALGVSSFMEMGFHNFQFFMNTILIFSFIFIFIHYNFKVKATKYTISQILLCVCIILCIFTCVIIRSFDEDIVFIGVLFSEIADYSPIFIAILLLRYDKEKLLKLLMFFTGFQTILALAVIYLPQVNYHGLDVIKGINYLSMQNAIQFDVSSANIFTLFSSLTNKYSFNQISIFHNSNDTGFYGATTAFLFFCVTCKSKKVFSKILLLVISFLGLLLWANSGMRGPIFGIILSIIIYYLIVEQKAGKKSIALALFLVIIAYIVINPEMILKYFNNSNIQVSFESRNIRRINGLSYIKDNLLFGSLGQPAVLTLASSDVHELPLYMAALFGLPVGIMYCFTVYIKPIKQMITQGKLYKSLISIGLYFILISVSLTNSFTDQVLFWFMLAVAIPHSADECTIESLIEKSNTEMKHCRGKYENRICGR